MSNGFVKSTCALAAILLAGTASGVTQVRQRGKTRNVFLVMTDGLRWQEVFRGADPALMNKEHGNVGDVDRLKRDFWRETPAARREALLPFLWTSIAGNGQIYGNRAIGSDAYVTNGLNFSYPGYSETLCGFADSRIDSNRKVPNPNVSALEWLHRKPPYRDKVAAFAAWDVLPFIINVDRAGFPVNASRWPRIRSRRRSRRLLGTIMPRKFSVRESPLPRCLSIRTVRPPMRHWSVTP